MKGWPCCGFCGALREAAADVRAAAERLHAAWGVSRLAVYGDRLERPGICRGGLWESDDPPGLAGGEGPPLQTGVCVKCGGAVPESGAPRRGAGGSRGPAWEESGVTEPGAEGCNVGVEESCAGGPADGGGAGAEAAGLGEPPGPAPEPAPVPPLGPAPGVPPAARRPAKRGPGGPGKEG
jgi:hypothetical protein